MDREANGVSAVSCLKSLGRVTVAATAFVLAIMPGAQAAESQADRTVLPMPNTARPDLVVYDAKDPDAVFPAILEKRAVLRFGIVLSNSTVLGQNVDVLEIHADRDSSKAGNVRRKGYTVHSPALPLFRASSGQGIHGLLAACRASAAMTSILS